MNIVSFFAGAGGLDLGFEKAGFDGCVFVFHYLLFKFVEQWQKYLF
ncbi:DNA cytosine methyltransferase [Capnocytophaga sp. ARDL2]